MKHQPVRLDKKEDFGRMELFCNKYSHIIVFFLIILLFVLIAMLVIAFINMGTTGNVTMTMTESNQYYYHLKDVI